MLISDRMTHHCLHTGAPWMASIPHRPSICPSPIAADARARSLAESLPHQARSGIANFEG